MKKSVYSLVLMDDVVAEVDRLAYETGTSRSNMINQILAEYVSYVTPEKRMREVFHQIESMLVPAHAFQVMLQPSDSMFSLRSALSYKYNPTVRYCVELYRNEKPVLGELRVSIRSQNNALMLYMMEFFKLWGKLETSLLGEATSAFEDGKYVRQLVLRGGETADNTQIGEAIASYIDVVDTALKTFFANLDQPAAATRAVERLYSQYLHQNPILV